MIRVHFWDRPDEAEAPELEDSAIFRCSFGTEIAADSEILVKGRPTAEDIATAPGLRAVIVPFAGIPAETRELLLPLTNIELYNLHHNAADTAEMAIALYLAAAKRIVPRDQALRRGQWSEDSFLRGGSPESVRAAGKRAVVLGYGSIGQRIGRICEAMEMDVVGIRRSGIFSEGVRPLEEIDQLLENTDALFVALPLTPETKGLLDARRLALLPSNAIISNIARGAIFDEEALFTALRDGNIGAAGIDVWWNYPNSDGPCFPSRFPFQDLPNVVMTPHVGGGSDVSERERMHALSTLIEAIAKGTPKTASKELGY